VHAFAAAAAAAFQVYKLPEPCTDAFLLQVSTWQHTRESEDLEAERREYYGSGGGSPFGARVGGVAGSVSAAGVWALPQCILW
jgi:hypothetical protein